MRQSETPAREVREARLASTKQVKAKVMDAEFPIVLKQSTEVLAQRLSRNTFVIIAAYGLATAEAVVTRADLVFS